MASDSTPTNTTSAAPAAQQLSSPCTQIVLSESQPIAPAPFSPRSREAIAPVVSVSVAPSVSISTETPIEPVVSVSTAPSSSASMEAAAGPEDDNLESSSVAQGNVGNKPAWNRPFNGDSNIPPVMGASLWPTPSETMNAPSDNSPSDSMSGFPAEFPSGPVSQVTEHASVPAQTQVNNAMPDPTPNNARQHPIRHNGTVTTTPMMGSFAELPSHSPSPRGNSQRNGFVPQSQSGNGNHTHRNLHRNQNGGNHNQQNYNQQYGGRRYQEQGNQYWNTHRSFNGRDGYGPHQRGAQGFIRPMQQFPTSPFMAAPQLYGNQVGFPELTTPMYYPAMPFIPPPVPAPVCYQVQEPPLFFRIHKQVQFYFSDENLIKDAYLRKFMDDQGFAPIQLIAGFRKIVQMTTNIQHIVDALQGSPDVEVQGDKIRKRKNWEKYVFPDRLRDPSAVSAKSAERVDALATQAESLSLEQNTSDHMASSSQPQDNSGGGVAVSSPPSNSN